MDIVEQLRDKKYPFCTEDVCYNESLMEDAADEIERVRHFLLLMQNGLETSKLLFGPSDVRSCHLPSKAVEEALGYLIDIRKEAE